MKKLTFLLIVAILLTAVAAFAQDGFKDVPDDHWAYDAVNRLQAAGLVQGYPGGLFMGKRTLTRYEFAMVISGIYDRLMGEIPEGGNTIIQTPGTPVDTSKFLTKNDVDNMLAAYTTKMDGLATKADVDAASARMGNDIKALGAEFRKELDSLGVRVSDLDAKVNDLAATVAALKMEVERVKITGNFNTYAKMSSNSAKFPGTVPIVDKNNRFANPNDNAVRAIAFLTDFDLSVRGKVSESTTVNALLNMGNYMSYLGQIDTFNYGPIAKYSYDEYYRVGATARDWWDGNGFFEDVFPYYLNLETKTGMGEFTIGRLPLQISRYTMKKIDVDDYTENMKTDDGNYPIDGIKLKSRYGGVDITGFAGKVDNNSLLLNGLSTAFETNGALDGVITEWEPKVFTQTAGVNVGFGTPMAGRLGLTYIRNWSSDAWASMYGYDQDEIMAADMSLPLPWFGGVALAASAGITNQLTEQAGDEKIDWRNGVYDVKLGGPIGPMSFGVGYKRIGENYVAPGDWGKIGRWQNPRMIKGLYADLGYSIMDNVSLNVGGEFYKFTDNKGTGASALIKDDKINRFTGGLQWKMSDANALGLDVEWITYDWSRVANFDGDKPTEKYITVGWNHRLNDDAALKIGYQLISYDKGYGGAAVAGAPVPYQNDYSGGLGVVQLGVSF